MCVCVCMWIRCQEGQVLAGQGDTVPYTLRNELTHKGRK